MAVGSRPLVPSRLAPGGIAHGVASARPPRCSARYVALTKPRIIELLLITTVPTMVLAERRLAVDPAWCSSRWSAARSPPAAPTPSTWYVDRDIDRLMPRTQDRPLVTGVIAPRQALVFAIGARGRRVRRAVGRRQPARRRARRLAPPLFYVFVYTLWLKRTSTPEHRHRRRRRRGAGARRLGRRHRTRSAGRRWCCSPSMFFWTPPHFWALAIRYADDYRAADVPMLPGRGHRSRHGPPDDRLHGRRWSCTTLVLAPVADLGWIYTVAAVVLGALFLARHGRPRPQPDAAALDARVRLQHHVRHAAVRRADRRRPRPVVTVMAFPGHAGRDGPLLGWRLVARTQPMVHHGAVVPRSRKFRGDGARH